MPDPLPPPVTPAPDPGKPFLGGRGFDLLMGLGILLISVISLVVAVSANRTQERMLAASVWPSLQFGTSNVGPDGEAQITFDLLNRGIGPARLRWAELSYDGQGVATLTDLLDRCCAGEKDVTGFTAGMHQRVLGADEWIQVVRVPKAGNSDALWTALEAARHDMRLRACYCSALDDCWLFDSESDDPDPVDRCPAAPPVLWGQPKP